MPLPMYNAAQQRRLAVRTQIYINGAREQLTAEQNTNPEIIRMIGLFAAKAAQYSTAMADLNQITAGYTALGHPTAAAPAPSFGKN